MPAVFGLVLSAIPAVAQSDENLILGKIVNNAQIVGKISAIEETRQQMHKGQFISKGLPLDLQVSNSGLVPLTLFLIGVHGGIEFYTLDDNGNRVDLVDSRGGGKPEAGGAFIIEPGATMNQTFSLPLDLVAQAKNGLYATLKLGDANKNNVFELSTGNLKISKLLSNLTGEPKWGEI